MTKRSKRNKKRTSSKIDEEFLEPYVNSRKRDNPSAVRFNIDTFGKLSLRNSKLTQVRKSNHYKNKNSPEHVKIKKLKNKITFNNKIEIDSKPLEDDVPVDVWDDSIFNSKDKRNKIQNINQLIPPVELPHPGQSYNPNPEDYQSLLNQASNVVQINNEDETIEGVKQIDDIIKNSFPSLDPESLDLRRKQALINLIKNNVFDLDEVNKVLNEEHESETEEEISEETMYKKLPGRKSKTQRNKMKLIKEDKRRKAVIKSIKKLKNDVNHIKSINSFKPSNKASEMVSRFRNFVSKLLSGEVPTKISNKTYYSDPPEVYLPEEMNSSVKNIDNLNKSPISHIVKSIYRRGLLPPPPKITLRYKNYLKKLKFLNRPYVYKPALTP
ncbi:Nop53 (60S ribosomal biogenesis) family protein [Theileria parva strain Muguga]|uniref:Nop53 (60S ribosomal biogenesis) family protein n=1 Tax=Theileria parva strain Muguga TaxID=333668 RepID=UPI001C61A035|nr:Nop53 (60S ribosomal biogenesis) family protein [Theileria parva strain Muguga]EAN32629.2 Nop53 (60S ribosomal biogenesis) family protein [Theileria parva strain Muguga]